MTTCPCNAPHKQRATPTLPAQPASANRARWHWLCQQTGPWALANCHCHFAVSINSVFDELPSPPPPSPPGASYSTCLAQPLETIAITPGRLCRFALEFNNYCLMFTWTRPECRKIFSRRRSLIQNEFKMNSKWIHFLKLVTHTFCTSNIFLSSVFYMSFAED